LGVVVDFDKYFVMFIKKSVFLPKTKWLDFEDATTLVWFVVTTLCLSFGGEFEGLQIEC
jgi:hypothetical protein